MDLLLILITNAKRRTAIQHAGGVRLFFGGVGVDGHIAFNEPGSPLCRGRASNPYFRYGVGQRPFLWQQLRNWYQKQPLPLEWERLWMPVKYCLLWAVFPKQKHWNRAVEGPISHMLDGHGSADAPQGHHCVVMEAAAAGLKTETVRYFKDIEKDNLL